MTKLDEHLYKQGDKYVIMLGYRLQSKDKQVIQKAYKECRQANFQPSKVNKILAKYSRYKRNKHKPYRIEKQKNHNQTLYIQGYYIATDTPQKIQELLTQYNQTNDKDTWLDNHVNHNHKKSNTGEDHIYYIKWTGRYRVSKYHPILKKQAYYGEYDTIEEAIQVRDKEQQKGWKIPPRKRKQYKWNKKRRYIHETPNGTYIIKRYGQHYGSWKTLEDAIEERDWLIKNNWSYENIDLY